jgi:hypothetical protein
LLLNGSHTSCLTRTAPQAFWDLTAPGLLDLSPAIDDVQLAPYGRVVNIYPLLTTRRNATIVIALGGHDLLNASSPVANRRSAALLAITSRQVMIEGPKSLLLPDVLSCGARCYVDPLWAILARNAIFVKTDAEEDEWSEGTTWPGVLPGQLLGPVTEATNCSTVLNAVTGRSICATNATGDGTRFWGYATVIVIWKQLLELSRVVDLGDATGAPYRWSVSRSSEASLGQGNFPYVYTSSNTGRLPTEPYDRGVVATVRVFTSVWAFTVEREGGWRPAWEGGVIAGVVLLSAVLAVFAFLLLLERSLHLELLYSMLPKRMVQRMRKDNGGFAESFEHVIVLFSDICSYTDLVGTLTPVQTMSMVRGYGACRVRRCARFALSQRADALLHPAAALQLNSLFADFDELVDKHGIVKVETIGDVRVLHACARPALALT